MRVLVLAVSVRLVVDELTVVLAAGEELHLASADSLVVGPCAFVKLAVGVVAHALAMASVVTVDSFVVAAVLEHDFDSTVGDETFLEASFDDLVLARVEDAVAVWLVILEVSLVEGTTVEHADAMTAPGVVLELTLVEVSVLKFHYAVAVALILAVSADVLAFLELLDFS